LVHVPQPPIRAFDVPTTFLSKKPVDQTWHGTKVPPKIPTKNLKAIRPDTLFTRPAIAVGIAPARSTPMYVHLGPKRSQRGPATNRTTRVPVRAAMLEFAISVCAKWRSSLIDLVSNGGNAYLDTY
jgi:hypothetical protein